MTQSLAGVLISIDDEGLVLIDEALYAFQNVLGATVDTISYYGAKSDRYAATFILDEDRNSNAGLSALKAALRANADINLTLNSGSFGNVRLLSLRASLKQALNHQGLVWKVSADLIATS